MGIDSAIEWTHHTFNPWEGCCKVSPACDNCYAEQRDSRWHNGKHWGKDGLRMLHTDSYWKQPLKWNTAAEQSGELQRVFCGSLCDVMEDRPDLQSIRKDELYPLIEQCDWLLFLMLTKRPQNFRKFLPKAWLKAPRPNIWGMTTVESQEYLWRADELINTPFAKRGLSMEPLLAKVDIRPYLHSIDWVIVGGESGSKARPTHPDWVRQLRDQCQDAGVAFFFKQWGEYQPFSTTDGIQELPYGRYDVISRNGFLPIGKARAGRVLDGREWNEIPASVPAKAEVLR